MRIPLIAFSLAATVVGQSAPQIQTVLVFPEETPSRAAPPSKPAKTADAVPQPPLAGLAPQPLQRVKLSGPYCSGFIRMPAISRDLKVLARFRGYDSVLATEGDFIYLSQGSRDGIAVGNPYQVVRPTKKMERPNGRSTKEERNLGMHYLHIAQIKVVLTQPEFSLARVFQTCDAVEIGDIAEPLQISEPPVEAGPRTFSPFMTVTGDVKGAVVTTLSVLLNFGSTRALPGVRTGNLSLLEKGLAHEGTIVYIDVGRREAVKAGDLFIVYRPIQLNKDLYPLPKELRKLQAARTAIGELIVVKAGERASAAMVTYADDAISAGDSVERR
ncbi:MAG: hypothetical protein HYU27_09485 [Acidobacteria bacterium]|nr:hypothetical protein [Acidobacteriota bacterium]